MPEMSGKCKTSQTKTNNLIYIMIFFWGEGVIKKILTNIQIAEQRY